MTHQFTYRTPQLVESSLSLDSSAASDSIYTTTSASTVPGIGALSGKFIYAFGKTILGALESVVVRRRLSYIQSICPLSDNTPPPDVEQIYDDLLELTRYVITYNTVEGTEFWALYLGPTFILTASEQLRCTSYVNKSRHRKLIIL
jgi:hypothetical protein